MFPLRSNIKRSRVSEPERLQAGSSRQAELRRLAPGERLHMVGEPHNPHDPRAVAVRSIYGITVGYLARDHATWVGSKMDRGYDVRAIVGRIKGEGLNGAKLGLVLLMNMEGEEPELEGGAALPWPSAP